MIAGRIVKPAESSQRTVILSPESAETVQVYNSLTKLWVQRHDDADYWEPWAIRFQELLPRGVVLDIGCGTGAHTGGLSRLGLEVHGIDPSSALLTLARDRYPDRYFEFGSFHSIPGDKLYDGFWAVASLLHIPKSEAGSALRNVRDRTRVGGLGFLVVKEGEGEIWKDERVDEVLVRRFFALYCETELRELSVAAGFSILQFERRVREDGGEPWLCLWLRAEE